MDPYEELNAAYDPHRDTLARRATYPQTNTSHHNSLPNQSILTQDFPLNPTHKTWLRLFKPINPPPNTKLPLVVYLHGGGFIICSPSDTLFHDFCTSMAVALPAVVLSVEYRLAPESRLPAAYEDALEALSWVRGQALGLSADNALGDIVDFSKCYVMGTSAGGNIAYHAGLRALCLDLKPLVIKGLILNQPYFSALERSESELKLADTFFRLAVSDLMWELSLPRGANRDHEYCNPTVDGGYKDKIGLLGRCFVNARGGDILVDRQMEFVKMLEENGVNVVTWHEEGFHGMDLYDPEKAKELFAALREFIGEQ